MINTLKLLTLVTLALFAAACSKGLRVLVYNNAGQAITFSFASGENETFRELAHGEKVVFPYGDVRLPAKLSVTTSDCEVTYSLRAPYGNYGDVIPQPPNNIHRIDLQIQPNLEFFLVPTGTDLPGLMEHLENQPEPFFPIKPSNQSCADS